MSKRSRPATLLLLLSSLALLPWLGCRDEIPPPELPPRAIQWQSVSTELTQERRVISGIVSSISDTVLAFEVGGTVKKVAVSLGDRVEEGGVLARLDPEPLALALRDAEAALAEARALQEAARADYERAASLFESRVISRQEYDRALAQRGSRDGQVAAARARLDLARRELRRSVLRAPFAGVVSVRAIEPAMKVATGQMAFEMDSAENGLRVEVQMPETGIARVHQGDEVEVFFPSLSGNDSQIGGGPFAAVVSEVGTRAGVGNAFPVRANLEERPARLRPGMTAEVAFTLGRSEDAEGFMIPIGATLAEAGGSFSVFVYDRESSRVNKRPVQSGGVRDNEIAVLEGLSAGEIIATAGVSFLRDGQKVTLLDGMLGASR